MALVAACAAPPSPPGASHDPANTPAGRADALLRDLAERQRFQGAAIVMRGGRVEYAAGFGHADVERGLPFTPDTPTDGASIAKTFTAAGLLALVAEKRVDLDAPVRTLLPGYPHPATRVRHLLAHSAGLPDHGGFDPRVPAGTVRTNASHLALMARFAPQPAFAPGSACAYDNVAYDAAAMVIERASGQGYAQFVRACFFTLLELDAFVRPARLADWPAPRTRGYRCTSSGGADRDA